MRALKSELVNKRPNQQAKADAAERALSKFRVFHEPKADKKIPTPLTTGHQMVTPQPSHPIQATIKADLAAHAQKNNPVSPQVESTDACATGKTNSQEISSERKPSKEDGEGRLIQAKRVNALVEPVESRDFDSKALMLTEPARAPMQCRPQRTMPRQFVQKRPLRQWAKVAYITSVYSGLALLLAASLIYAFRRNVGDEAEWRQQAGRRVRSESTKTQGVKRNSTKSHKARGRTIPSQEKGIREGDTIGEPGAVNGVPEEYGAEPLLLMDYGSSTTEKKPSPATQTKVQPILPPAIEQNETQPTYASSALKGLLISVESTKTVRSAYATNVTARVTTDMRDNTGKLVIPAGTLVQVPLGAPDQMGRFGSEPGASAWITLSDGADLPLKVSVQGADGGSGLSGKYRKPGRLGKIFRGIGKAGAALGQEIETTREAAQVLEEALSGYSDTGDKVAEIKAGTRFRLLVR